MVRPKKYATEEERRQAARETYRKYYYAHREAISARRAKRYMTKRAAMKAVRNVTRADKIASPGLITAQAINSVLEADLIIADLTGPNANAFYELALAHMAERKVIQMITEGQKIPFDVQEVRTVHYSRVTVEDVRKAVAALETHVRAAEQDGDHVSNPVTTARGIRQLMLKGTADTSARIVEDLMMSNRALVMEVAELSRRLLGVEYRTAGLPIPGGFFTTGPNALGVGGFITTYAPGTVAAQLAELANRKPAAGSTPGILNTRYDENTPSDAGGKQQADGEPNKTDG